MATNEGVGKKIVEALKKQANPEIELSPEYTETQEDVVLDVAQEDNTVAVDTNMESLYDGQFSQENEPVTIEEDKFEIKEEPVEQKPFVTEQSFVQDEPSKVEISPQQVNYAEPKGWNFSEVQEESPVFNVSPAININTIQQEAKQFDMPPNVAVLKKLITQLPSGVTKQTGAQIIKQTMEALGISMTTVLHEAQKVQDDMNDSIKNCMVTIQEYKNNIKNLERQGLDYQRQVNQLNDLISLFILSDKD